MRVVSLLFKRLTTLRDCSSSKTSFSVTFNEVRDWDRDGLGPKIIYNLHVTLDWLQKLDGLVKLRKAWIKVKHIHENILIDLIASNEKDYILLYITVFLYHR